MEGPEGAGEAQVNGDRNGIRRWKETPRGSGALSRLQVKPSSLLDWSRQPAPHGCPRDRVSDRDGPSCCPAREETVQSAPHGCSAELSEGRDPEARITPKTQSRLTRERCSGRTEERPAR